MRPEEGGIEDVQLVLDLHDAQQLTGKVGRIHQIMALNCKCKGNRISVIRRELEGVLPDTKVTEQLGRATAREQQRNLVEQKRAEQLQLLKANREQQTEIVKANREHWGTDAGRVGQCAVAAGGLRGGDHRGLRDVVERA